MGIKGKKTILGTASAELIEKKSRFLAAAFHAETDAECAALAAAERVKYRDARHVCFAYITDGGRTVRMSDDGEPSGTAGVPILDLLQKRGLVDCLVCVTRWFGGILLGAPGLVRAYSGAAKSALDAASPAVYAEVSLLTCLCGYSDYERLRNFLERSGAWDLKAQFAAEVTLTLLCDAEHAETLCASVFDRTAGRISLSLLETRAELRPL